LQNDALLAWINPMSTLLSFAEGSFIQGETGVTTVLTIYQLRDVLT
jgi:hypothetical protein